MTTRRTSSQAGTVTLVALCFAAVIGIALASYITVCSRAMTLSDRSFRQNLSTQIAELAMEEALRAVNTNNWDDWTSGSISTNWTLSGTTATCTITFPTSQFGQGTSATASIRVDNYNAPRQGETWDSATAYRINDLVGYNGIWYRCIKNHTNQTPTNNSTLTYWAPEPIPWQWVANTSYAQYDVINYDGAWYFCSTAHTSASSFSATNWTLIPTLSLGWDSTTTYTAGSFVYYSGTWYRCTLANTNSAPPDITYWSTGAPFISWTWRYSPSTTYYYNDVVYYQGIWWRCTTRNYVSDQWWEDPGSIYVTYWENALTGTMWDWDSGENYNIGDAVYRSGIWYRCIRAHSNQAPPNTTYWSNTPLRSSAWQPGKSYNQNDTVFHNGYWYLSLQSANVGNNPAFSSSYWAIAPRTIETWSSTKIYHVDDLVSSGGAWYRCIKGHTNQSPPSTDYWVSMAGASYQWSSATAYAVGAYANYGGAWYRCAAANTNQSPNNATYWTALGTTVVFARGTITYADGSTGSTQLRGLVAPASQFPNAIGASTYLTISGGGTVDSYDGSVHSLSAAGSPTSLTYNSSATPFGVASPNISYAATLAAGSTSGTALSVSSTTVQGYFAAPSSTSSPYAPLLSIGASVSLTNPTGGVTSPHATAASVDLTRINRSPYIPVFSPQPTPLSSAISSSNFPAGTTFVLPTSAVAVNIGTPGATTPSRYFYNGSLTLSAGLTLNINGPIILYINGNLRTTGTGQIIINSTGSAEIHIDGRLRIEAASNGIINRTQDPKRLVLISDISDTNTQYYNSTANDFYGIIYVPYTTTSAGLAIGDGVDVYGALSASEVTLSVTATAPTLHYDTSLLHNHVSGIDAPYTLSQLRELTTTGEKVAF